jgi:prevent-host-death family protein
MINISKDIQPISYFKSHSNEIMNKIKTNKNPIVITQKGKAKAVLLDVDYYQDLLNSIYLMKLISIGENDIKNGHYIKQDDLDKKIRKVLD